MRVESSSGAELLCSEHDRQLSILFDIYVRLEKYGNVRRPYTALSATLHTLHTLCSSRMVFASSHCIYTSR